MTTHVQKQPKRFSTKVIIIGIVAIILLMALPLIIVQDSEFGGSDGAGSDAIERIAPEYNPAWATNWWSPPGSETESMLFALQATTGGILIGYFFGYLRGRKKERAETAKSGSIPVAQEKD